MDILALRSIVTSTNSIYCNLTIVSLFKEIVSSKFVYFSDGSDVLINFYSISDEHDTVERKDWSRTNYGRFEVFVTDCYETESMTTKKMLQEIIYYEANPRSFLYEATFRELNFLLTNDQNFESDTSSRIISLHRKKTPEPRVRNYDVASIELDQLERVRNSEVQFFFVLDVIWIFCREVLHMLGLYVTVWILSYLKIVLRATFIPSLFNLRATSVTLFGSMIKEMRCLRKPWLEQVDQSLRQENSSSTSSSEEYYTMIENASGNIALEYMSWSCDTESESENSTVDINCNRSRSVSCDNSKKDTEAANDLCIPVNISDILHGYPTPRFATKIPEKFPIANVEALSNCQQHKANSDICCEVALPTCSIEVAFLAGEPTIS